MPLLRINAHAQGLTLHGSPQPVARSLAHAPQGPATIMVHGYKYSPFVTARCPHGRLFRPAGWPLALGLERPGVLGVAFGWHARGGLMRAYGRALARGAQLAQLVALLRGRGPVNLIAHSLGATLVLAALPYLRAGDVGRIVLLSGAAHLGVAHHALASPAGQAAQVIHVTGRENALFDLGFERLTGGSGAIGRGLPQHNALRLGLDCPLALAALARLGWPLAPQRRRICHWSSYTRPGIMALNAALLDGRVSLPALRAALPPDASPPLALRHKSGIMSQHRTGTGTAHEHAY